MPNTTDNFDIPFLDGTELVRDYPQFSEDLAEAIDDALPVDATPAVAGVVKGTTSDGSNTALGNDAFTSNTTGDENTAVGSSALRDNTTGNEITAIGRTALQNNTTSFNTAVGSKAAFNNTTGGQVVAVGRRAMFSNTTGSDITAVGTQALDNNTTGIWNTALGRSALFSNVDGSRNIAVGRSTLASNTTGSNNTALGQAALPTTTTGINNTGVGFAAESSSATVNNQITLGNSAISSLRCNVTTISSLSDVRDKTDIETTEYGLEFVNKLRPVEFAWDRRDGTMAGATDIGFIAQELAELEDEYDDAERLRLTLRDNPEKLEASPGRLIPVLVKAVQDLSAQNEELVARIEALEAK